MNFDMDGSEQENSSFSDDIIEEMQPQVQQIRGLHQPGQSLAQHAEQELPLTQQEQVQLHGIQPGLQRVELEPLHSNPVPPHSQNVHVRHLPKQPPLHTQHLQHPPQEHHPVQHTPLHAAAQGHGHLPTHQGGAPNQSHQAHGSAFYNHLPQNRRTHNAHPTRLNGRYQATSSRPPRIGHHSYFPGSTFRNESSLDIISLFRTTDEESHSPALHYDNGKRVFNDPNATPSQSREWRVSEKFPF